MSYSGIIYDGSTFFPSASGANGYSYLYGGEVAQPGNLTQAGPGGLTLDNSQMRYTGTTTVAGGALEITNASSSMAVLTTTKVSMGSGFLVLNYSANLSNQERLVSAVQSVLHASYNGGVNPFQPQPLMACPSSSSLAEMVSFIGMGIFINIPAWALWTTPSRTR